MMKIKSHRSVGIVIDALQVRALELSKNHDEFEIIAYAKKNLPLGVVNEGIIVNIEKMAEIINGMFAENKFSDCQWVVGARNQNVIMRMSAFPKVSEDKMDNVIMFQAQQAMPVSVSELVLDYLLCDQYSDDGRDMVNALLVGAKKPFIHNIFTLSEACHRGIAEIDSAMLAVLRAFSYSQADKNEVVLVAYVDCETIGIVVVQNEVILLTRTTTLPNEAFAEVKAAVDLENCIEEQNSATQEEDFPQTVNPQLYHALEIQLENDLRTSMSYFATQHTDIIEKVVIAGSVPFVDLLSTAISKQIFMPVEAATFYPQLLGQEIQDYACCISLAARGLEE